MIQKLRLLFWLGIVMIFLSFFGIPNTWKMVIAVAIGIALLVISVALRKQYRLLRIHIRNLEHTAVEQTIGVSEPENIQ